ncbi:MAG: hypothetical protein ABEJ74_06240 [Haloferacaceae archaeon]
MNFDCTYCGCDVRDHDPVYVREGSSGDDAGATRAFCNYGCLAAHVDEAGLAAGTSCRVDP